MSKLLSLVTLSSILALTLLSGPTSVSAVAVEHNNLVSRNAHNHHGIAKRKRNLSKRCKARHTSSSAAAAKPTATSKGSNTSSGSSGSSGNSGSSNSGSSGSSGSSGGNNVDAGDHSLLGYAWVLDNGLLDTYKQGKKTLIYNWGPTGPSHDGYEFMPMLWGKDDVSKFKSAVSKKTPKYALGCNEPELSNGSGLSAGMSTDEALSAYWEGMDWLADKGTVLLTPAVTSGPKGLAWMKEFMGKCKGCRFGGQAIHWYDITADDAIAHFKRHHDAFGLPLYITEMAFQNFNGDNQLSVAQAKTEMTKFNNWVKGEGSSFVKLVTYFGFQADMVNVSENLCLINKGTGKPNSLGQLVIDQLGQ